MHKHISISLITITHLIVWFYLIEHSNSVVMYFNISGFEMPYSYINNGIYASMFFNALIVYVNYSYLINRYMPHKFKLYLIFSSLLLVLVSLAETLVDIIQVDGLSFLHSSDIGQVILSYNLKINFFYWIFSLLLKVTLNWLIQQKRQKEIKQKQVQTELALLKSQVHPHFLFNTLNTLYSSSYEFGDTSTADGIGKLSHLLRYMLYETGDKKVQLENEIEYLTNYIDLQKMRFSNEVQIDFEINGDISIYTIAPMMLITLVENAFKHGITPTKQTSITITLTNNIDIFSFQVENEILRNRPTSILEKGSGGLGLPNLIKRLEMIYPNQYQLNIDESNNRFIARLELL